MFSVIKKILILVILCGGASVVHAQEYDLNTYYASPTGQYESLNIDGNLEVDTLSITADLNVTDKFIITPSVIGSSCQPGEVMVDAATNLLRICSPNGTFTDLGMWTNEGDYIIPTPSYQDHGIRFNHSGTGSSMAKGNGLMFSPGSLMQGGYVHFAQASPTDIATKRMQMGSGSSMVRILSNGSVVLSDKLTAASQATTPQKLLLNTLDLDVEESVYVDGDAQFPRGANIYMIAQDDPVDPNIASVAVMNENAPAGTKYRGVIEPQHVINAEYKFDPSVGTTGGAYINELTIGRADLVTQVNIDTDNPFRYITEELRVAMSDPVDSAAAIDALNLDGRLLTVDTQGRASWSQYGGLPKDAVMGFLSSTCPKGWVEFTEAKGRFIVGEGAGLHSVPFIYGDQGGSADHQHDLFVPYDGWQGPVTSTVSGHLNVSTPDDQEDHTAQSAGANDGRTIRSGIPPGSPLPPHLAVTYCRKMTEGMTGTVILKPGNTGNGGANAPDTMDVLCDANGRNCVDICRLHDCVMDGTCGGAATPTCSDGIQNQGEAGIDCGGPCAACLPAATCNDGIQNQGETTPDCGGPCGTCAECGPAINVTEYPRTDDRCADGSYADVGPVSYPWTWTCYSPDSGKDVQCSTPDMRIENCVDKGPLMPMVVTPGNAPSGVYRGGASASNPGDCIPAHERAAIRDCYSASPSRRVKECGDRVTVSTYSNGNKICNGPFVHSVERWYVYGPSGTTETYESLECDFNTYNIAPVYGEFGP